MLSCVAKGKRRVRAVVESGCYVVQMLSFVSLSLTSATPFCCCCEWDRFINDDVLNKEKDHHMVGPVVSRRMIWNNNPTPNPPPSS